MRMTIIIFTLALAGCAQDLPDLRGSISAEAQGASYPELVPLDALLARAQSGSSIAVQTEQLAARVARLKRRAAAIRGRSIVDGATRLRLIEASRRAAARS